MCTFLIGEVGTVGVGGEDLVEEFASMMQVP
jgi:hypothetical protein